MTFRCADLEAALCSDDPARLEAAASHARECAACRDELRLWNEISEAARGLRRDWDSPGLWPRIRHALAAEPDGSRSRRALGLGPLAAWRPLAAAAVLAVAGTWLFLRVSEPRPDAEAGRQAERRLLTEDALAAVERSEAEYVRAIDELSTLVEPRLQAPRSPLLLSFREKLTLIDAAIAECRAQIERNRFNAHLRRELLSIYGEKQRTLEQVLVEEKNAL
jgi:hypothetical protein